MFSQSWSNVCDAGPAVEYALIEYPVFAGT